MSEVSGVAPIVNPAVATSEASSNVSSAPVSGTVSGISGIEDLRALPGGQAIYDAIMMSIANNVKSESDRHMRRMKEINEQGRGG